MSAQSVSMDEDNWTNIRRALTNQEIEAIELRESSPNDMTYWLDTLLEAAGSDGCDFIATIRDGKILELKIRDFGGGR